MRRNDLVALVAGASVGVVGGGLAAGLACTVGGAVLYRLLDQLGFDDQYFELSQPLMLTARQRSPQTSLRSAYQLPPASALPLSTSVPNAGAALPVTAK